MKTAPITSSFLPSPLKARVWLREMDEREVQGLAGEMRLKRGREPPSPGGRPGWPFFQGREEDACCKLLHLPLLLGMGVGVC